VAKLAGFDRIITLIWVATSTMSPLVDGTPAAFARAQVAGTSRRVPMLDIHTVGAAADRSLARRRRMRCASVHNRRVPIRSYLLWQRDAADRHRREPDLGRLDPDRFPRWPPPKLDTPGRVNTAKPRRVRLRRWRIFANGIVRLAEAAMEKAIRLISSNAAEIRATTAGQLGVAGGLHAVALARALRSARACRPPCFPGALSALGILNFRYREGHLAYRNASLRIAQH